MGENHHKVLIVDDERAITDTLALIFAGNGYNVRKAYSAEQAVDLIAQWRPDLAILDRMPWSARGLSNSLSAVF